MFTLVLHLIVGRCVKLIFGLIMSTINSILNIELKILPYYTFFMLFY